MKSFVIVSICLLVTILAAPVFAHHEFAFDDSFDGHPVKVTGKVVKVTLTNPHVQIEIDAVDSNNKTVRWVLEGSGIARVRQFGLDKDTLKSGDAVTACGFPGKGNVGDTLGKKVLSAERITIPSGRKLAFMEFNGKFMTSVSQHCD